MDNIIVYVDDAAYARQMLQPMLADGQVGPTRWIVVGCAPRVTHHASRWVTNRARESWRGKWADKVFSQITPLLDKQGDTVVTRLAQQTLRLQTESLMKELGVARVLDARRPKFGQDLEPVTAVQTPTQQGALGYFAAVAGAGLLVATD